MSVTVEGHYDGVRYAPPIRRAQPFQILGYIEDWQGSVDRYRSLVIFLNLREAKDLHDSLGVLLNNVEEDKDV